MAQTTTQANSQTPNPAPGTNGTAPAVNRKKQKRRQKLEAKRLAEQPAGSQTNGAQSSNHDPALQEVEARLQETGLGEGFEENGQFDPAEGEQYYSEEEGDGYSGSYGQNGSSSNGYAMPQSGPSGKKSKKKKKSKGVSSQTSDHIHTHAGTNGHNHISLPPLASTNMPRGPGISKEKIWNTSSAEERERIKEFWLSLGEDERKSLVKVEKDAVLKKMKEQQKHSCSCTVCGRKRTAIEEELEVLYDAYYEELEQYANGQGDGRPAPMMAPPRRFGALSGLQPPNRLPPAFNGQQPSRGRIVEDLGDDEDEEGDEEYSDEEGDEDDYSDEEPDELPRPIASDFFNFGNSLTVQGGILTVADDLLKNDGKKFIEMMEQLAERRMAREEDAREQFSNPNYGHPPNGSMHSHSHTHNHPPQPDDEEYDDEEEDEEDYDSQEEDYDEEEMVRGGKWLLSMVLSNLQQDSMTEEQRMEEGRRMFQIFAARMFEQRVLQAYREKVSKERQQKLLEELEEERAADSQKKAKKAKDAQKKKEKLAQKKQAAAEEKQRRDAEKAAEEAELRAIEEKKLEEARLKAEEKRKKKEAQRKLEEEERLRKEAEKQRARERIAEAERKAKEAKEKERKEKEELKRKEKEAREAKEREARERKEKAEKEKREKEAKLKAEKEAKEKQRLQELAAQQAVAQAALAATQAIKRPPVPIPANLQPHAIASPHIPVATPAIPKAPTPIKLRTTSSQQDSNSSVPHTPQTGGVSQNVSPVPTTPLQGSPGPIGPPGKQTQNSFLHQPQATSPMHAALKSPPGMPQQPSPFGIQPMGMGFQPGFQSMDPRFGGIFPHQQGPGQFRPIAGPNGMPMHPGLMHQIPQGRGFPPPHGPPGFPQPIPNGLAGLGQPFGTQKEGPMSQPHSRQQSGSFEKPFEPPGNAPQAQPIARPAPIGRPSSVVHGQRHGGVGSIDMDDLSNHLGSSALLDDSDETLTSGAGARRPSVAPGLNTRPNFPPPFGMEPFASPIGGFPTWGAPQNPFGTSSLPGSNYMGGWGPPSGGSFGAVGGAQAIRPSQPRSVVIRLLIYQACKTLEGSNPDGFYDINAIKEQVNTGNSLEQLASEQEILDICETEGNAINGGGSFDIRKDNNGHYSIRYEDDMLAPHRPVGAPGEIGSPIVGGGGISRFTGPPPGF
jgi:hypothetical protein